MYVRSGAATSKWRASSLRPKLGRERAWGRAARGISVAGVGKTSKSGGKGRGTAEGGAPNRGRPVPREYLGTGVGREREGGPGLVRPATLGAGARVGAAGASAQ